MDVSPQALVGAVLEQSAASTTQQIQVSVLKKALDAQASGALGLLAGLNGAGPTGPLPLAPDGNLGTNLNVMV